MRVQNVLNGLQERGWMAVTRVFAVAGRAVDAYAARRLREANRALQWHRLTLDRHQPSSMLAPDPEQAIR